MRIVLLFAVVLLVNSYSYGVYQTGNGVGVFSSNAPSHVLMTQTNPGRSVDIEVEFEQAFDQLPKVAVANSIIDWQQGTPSGYNTEVLHVTTKGFTIRAFATTDKKIHSLSYNWFATTDDRIHIQYIQTSDLGDLSQEQEGARQHTLNIPVLNWKIEENTLAATFLIGADFTSGSYASVKQQVTNINKDSVDLLFQTDKDCVIKSVKICLVMSAQKHSYNTGDMGLKVNDDHPWMNREGSQDSLVDANFQIPSDVTQEQRSQIAGITGFEVEVDQANLRIEIGKIKESNNQARLSYGTWGNSKLRELGFEAFFFTADKHKIFDAQCAELFSQPNYKGKSMKICDASDDIQGHEFTVRSVHLPEGASMTLYDQKSFNGESFTIYESQPDLENLKSDKFGVVFVGEEGGEDAGEDGSYCGGEEEGFCGGEEEGFCGEEEGFCGEFEEADGESSSSSSSSSSRSQSSDSDEYSEESYDSEGNKKPKGKAKFFVNANKRGSSGSSSSSSSSESSYSDSEESYGESEEQGEEGYGYASCGEEEWSCGEEESGEGWSEDSEEGSVEYDDE